jgi:hypothetical protein
MINGLRKTKSGVMAHTYNSSFPALGQPRQEDLMFEARLVYITSSRLAFTT